MAPSAATVFRKNPDIVAREVFDEHVLVPVSGVLARENRLFTLDRIGQAIWLLIDGQRSAAQIVAALQARFVDDPARVQRETPLFLEELRRLGLIEARS
jgi:hypothetical protein